MIPLFTALLLLVYLTVIGMAVMQAIGFRFGVLRAWLLAPVSGLAVLTISVMVLSQAGVPVRRFATGLALVLLAASCAILWWRRPILPWKRLAPFWSVLVFALIYIGWQAVPYGFNWAGYGNADALAYCQSASRLIDHGFFETPKLDDLLGRDHTQASWFQFGPGMYRCGFDLLLAWAASVVRMNPFAIYMPVMLCLGLIQISAVSALVMNTIGLGYCAVIAAALLAMSPLFGFTVIAQLGPQVGGLALLLGLCALTLWSAPGGRSGWLSALKHGFVISLLGLSLVVFYPEALPFFGASFLVFHLALALTGHGNLRYQMRVVGMAAVATIVMGRANILRGYFSAIFAIQFSKATETGEAVYTGFEAFKLPHGPAALFGLSDYQRLSAMSWLSGMIVLGFLLMAVCLIRAVIDAVHLKPYAFVLLTFATVSAIVYRSPNSFGLFKMALYIQPVVLAALAHAVGRPKPLPMGALGTVYFLLSFGPHGHAVRSSTGALTGLSSTGVNLPPVTENTFLETDAATSVPASLLLVYLKGVPQELLNGRTNLSQMKFVDGHTKPLLGPLNPYPAEVIKSDELVAEVSKASRSETLFGFTFQHVNIPRRSSDQVVLASVNPDLGYFNNLNPNHYSRTRDYFVYSEIAAVKNHLVFVNSNKSYDYYMSAREASYYALEDDLYRPSKNFFGIGRYFLFQVLNPSDKLRVRISLSRTVMGDGRTTLPSNSVVLADHEERIGMVGSGAANLFSESVRAVSLHGRSYLALDLKDEPISPPNRKAGLMLLYNREIPMDVRRFIGFGRDISVISDEEYQRLERPRSVARWPYDLFRGAGLEFSGFYEDGWVSDHALIRLGPSKAGEHLVIRGMTPGIGVLGLKGNVLRVSIDGKAATTESLRPGAFVVNIPLRSELRITSVNLDFSLRESLPKGDDRPVAAKIEEIAIR
jgi:hypothetical protein